MFNCCCHLEKQSIKMWQEEERTAAPGGSSFTPSRHPAHRSDSNVGKACLDDRSVEVGESRSQPKFVMSLATDNNAGVPK